MRKHDKTLRVVAFAVLVVMIGLVLISSTYAKYTTSYTGTDTVTVAKFSVGADNVTSFDLFNTIYDTDGTSAETDVSSNLIAPGTSGSFDITLTNSSEVTVEYYLIITESENSSDVPIEYSLDGTTYYTADEFASLTNSTIDSIACTKTDNIAISGEDVTVTVYWRWAYEGADSTNYTSSQTDATDTSLGTSTTAPTVTVTASAVFTQVD